MPPVDWNQFNLINNLANLSVQDIPEAEVMRQYFPKWMTTPQEFAAEDMQDLINALQKDSNFWMLAILEYRFTKLFGDWVTDWESRMDAVQVTLDAIESNTGGP